MKSALEKIVREFVLTRRQARQLRKLREYAAARAVKLAARTYMKCARIVRKSILEGAVTR